MTPHKKPPHFEVFFFVFNIKQVAVLMIFHVYVIYSVALDSFYIGFTESLSERIVQHNQGFYQGAYKKMANDWELFHYIECESKKQAVKSL